MSGPLSLPHSYHRPEALPPTLPPSAYRFGLGLRHEHYEQALTSGSDIDFVEVHSENFFAPGGASKQLIGAIAERYPLSLHCTSMGLGSSQAPSASYMQTLAGLIADYQPLWVSDHACFNRASFEQSSTVGGDHRTLFTGDLLPLSFHPEWLRLLVDNVKRVQDQLGRQILVENLSAYLSYEQDCMAETEFLNQLAAQSGCGLLLDLNNLLINAHNRGSEQALSEAKLWLAELDTDAVQEIHLAGYSQQKVAGFYVDDHSQAVSDECWQLYHHALEQIAQPVATLVEWDNQLPSWQRLLQEVDKAKAIAAEHHSIQLRPAAEAAR